MTLGNPNKWHKCEFPATFQLFSNAHKEGRQATDGAAHLKRAKNAPKCATATYWLLEEGYINLENGKN